MRPPRKFRPEPFAYHQEVEVRIETLTNLGVGLGRVDGWVVMVPLALPGERVRARVWSNRSNYSEADLVEVLEAAPERVEPRCPLFGTCGGCQYQHLDAAAQLAWKRRHVEDAVRRIARLEVAVDPVVPSPLPYGYRSKLTPHWDRPGRGEELPIGFLRAGSRRIVDVPECPLATPAVNGALPAAREAVREGVRSGRIRRGGTLLVRETLEGVTTDPNARVTERVGDLVLEFVAGEFFQNNRFQLPAMVGHALDEAGGEGIRYFVDAYGGAGLFGLSAAKRFVQVAGVEVSTAAVELARANATRNGLTNVSYLAASAEAIFAGLEFPAGETAVLLDPPRRGSDEVFLGQLVAYGPARIVYVSCDPATQARDLAWLAANGYRLARVRPFDLFPQTRHIEAIATLVREG